MKIRFEDLSNESKLKIENSSYIKNRKIGNDI